MLYRIPAWDATAARDTVTGGPPSARPNELSSGVANDVHCQTFSIGDPTMDSLSRARKMEIFLGLGVCVAVMGACTGSTSSPPANAGGGGAGSSSTATSGTKATGGITGTGGTTGGATANGGSTAPGSGGSTAPGSGGSTAPGSGGSTAGDGGILQDGPAISLPPACPKHMPLSCPAIDSTKAFGSLSQADVSALCDCRAAAYGGYATSRSCMCADGSMAIDTRVADKAACIAAYDATPACTWLMSDYYTCMDLMQDTCNMMGMTQSLGSPSCAGGMSNPACSGQ